MTTLPVVYTINLDDRDKHGKPLTSTDPDYNFTFYEDDMIQIVVKLIENGKTTLLTSNHVMPTSKRLKMQRQSLGMPLKVKQT